MGKVGSNDVVARSSRPSLSKSSMTAPPAMLNRSTLARWPMSRNLPDVELGFEKRVDRDQVPRIDLVRVFAQRHVSHVQQPADIMIVGKILQIFGEVPDRQPGTGRVGVHGRGAIGRMHELSPLHITQLSVSPRRRAVTPWK